MIRIVRAKSKAAAIARAKKSWGKKAGKVWLLGKARHKPSKGMKAWGVLVK